MPRIVVIGGGISGLSAAFAIRTLASERGIPVELSVLESESTVGGKVRTIEADGFLCEWGVQGFLDNSPPTLELAKTLGLHKRLRAAAKAATNRWIVRHRRLEPVPMGPGLLFRSRILTLKGKLRLACEPFIRPRRSNEDETVAAFARRRLGKEALDNLIGPMVSGVFAGDPEALSVRSAFPKVAALEEKHGGLVRGMLALRKERGPSVGPGPSGTLHSFDRGMAVPVESLAKTLGNAVRLLTQAKALSRAGAGFAVHAEGGSFEADAVVLAVPAYEQARLLGPLDASMADLLSTIPYPPLAVICLGYKRAHVAHPLDGFGFLVPHSEPSRMRGKSRSISNSSTASEEGGEFSLPATSRTRAPRPSGRSPTMTARSFSVISSLLMGRALPVMVVMRAFSAGSQVAKHPSLYWRATASSMYGTSTRSLMRTMSVKKLRRPSSRAARAMAAGVLSSSHISRGIGSPMV